jgi:hypothetical protein
VWLLQLCFLCPSLLERTEGAGQEQKIAWRNFKTKGLWLGPRHPIFDMLFISESHSHPLHRAHLSLFGIVLQVKQDEGKVLFHIHFARRFQNTYDVLPHLSIFQRGWISLLYFRLFDTGCRCCLGLHFLLCRSL